MGKNKLKRDSLKLRVQAVSSENWFKGNPQFLDYEQSRLKNT